MKQMNHQDTTENVHDSIVTMNSSYETIIPVISMNQKIKYSIMDYFSELVTKEDYSLYSLTVTYKPYSSREYKEKDVNEFYKNFYLKSLLPYLMKTRNCTRPNKRHLQPISFVFLDEHEMEPKKRTIRDLSSDGQDCFEYQFPIRLHHHVVIAVPQQIIERMNSLIGENTIVKKNFSKKIMTSCIDTADLDWIPYASKRIDKYPDYMIFGKRHESINQPK